MREQEDTLKIIERYKPYILHLAKEYSNQVCSIDDLYSESVMKILECINKFDESRGSLHSLILKSIRNVIHSYSFSFSMPVSIPSGSITAFLGNGKQKLKSVPYESVELYSDLPKQLFDSIDLEDLVAKYDVDDLAHLYIIDRHTYNEIAKMKGMKPSMVCKKIKGIKRKILNEIK